MHTFSSATLHNESRLGRAAGPYADGFADFVEAAAIAKKRFERFGADRGANSTPARLEGRGLTRNVCVRVDAVRVAELDAITTVLGCSKQEFLIEALSAGIEQAKASLERHGVLFAYNEIIDPLIAELGFTFVEGADGFVKTQYDGKPVVADE